MIKNAKKNIASKYRHIIDVNQNKNKNKRPRDVIITEK